MLKRTMTAALLITLVVGAGSVSAQCVLGVYADAAGTISATAPTLNIPFNVYVILREEAAVEGVAYTITVPNNIAVLGRFMGPNGLGFEFLTDVDPGFTPPWFLPLWYETISAFGECVIGFGGQDILVARYQLMALDWFLNEEVVLSPNATENPASVTYATCAGTVGLCDNTQNLLITKVIGTESKSFGAVKSLY